MNNFNTVQFTVAKIIEQIDNGIVCEISDNFSSDLIQMLLLRFPTLPMVMLISSNELSVIDGQKRISAIYNFVQGRYKLEGLNLTPELNGKMFNDLDKCFQRRILESEFVVYTMLDSVDEKFLWAFLKIFTQF